MAYFHLESFKAGLDTRRSVLTSLPGTLQTCQDAHINQGGEVVKRFAFVYKFVYPTYFGLEGLDAGLTVFGSRNVHGGAAPAQTDSLSAPFVYQQLVHPSVSVFGIAYDASYHEMTAVVSSQCYLGKALVLATYSDGYTFLFYDGTPVMSSYSGIVLHGYTVNTVGTPAAGTEATVNRDLVNGFLTIPGWYGIPGVLINGVPLSGMNAAPLDIVTTSSFPGKVDGCVLAPVSQTFTIDKTLTTSAGILEFALGGTSVAASAGTAATTVYAVSGTGGDQYQIYIPVTSASTIYYWVVINLNWAVSNANTAGLIVTAINAKTALHGFSAANGGTANVTISAPIPQNSTLSAWPNPQPTYTWNAAIIRKTGVGSSSAFGTGTVAIPALGQYEYFLFDNAWVTGDTWSLEVTSTGATFTVGRGNLPTWVTGATVPLPNAMYVFNEQAFLANGNQFNYSSPGDPTGWEQQNTNAGFTPYTSQFGHQDAVQAFAAYQSQLAVFGRRSVQIWNWSASPSSQSKSQTLANIGTLAPLSVAGLGDLDVMFMADTGIRSLRAKATTNNAFVNDIGSPIDALITPTTTDCAGVEPTEGRYLCYNTEGQIYVLSYFPTNQIVAWSSYVPRGVTSSTFLFTITSTLVAAGSTLAITIKDGWGNTVQLVSFTTLVDLTAADAATNIASAFSVPNYTANASGHSVTFASTQGNMFNLTIVAAGLFTYINSDVIEAFTAFVPQKFVTYQNRLYSRSHHAVHCYGGDTGVWYDTTSAVVTTPWLDAKMPDTAKGFSGIDLVINGRWAVLFGTDWIDSSWQQVIALCSNSTFDAGAVAFNSSATHFSFKLTSVAEQAGATLSQLIALYQVENPPV